MNLSTMERKDRRDDDDGRNRWIVIFIIRFWSFPVDSLSTLDSHTELGSERKLRFDFFFFFLVFFFSFVFVFRSCESTLKV